MNKKIFSLVILFLISTSLFAQYSENYELDIILTDKQCKNDNDTVGFRRISHCNYLKYEAECALSEYNDLKEFPSDFHYKITREVGEKNIDQYASHLYAWQCYEDYHNAGYAAERLYWKWTGGVNYPKNEIRFMNQDTMFFDFVMRIDDDFGYSDTTAICDANVFVIVDGSKVYLPINSYEANMYDDNKLSVGDFKAMSATGFIYVPFTFYTIIDSIDSSLITNSRSLKNINFEVYWHDKDNLYVDYFRVYDDVYNKLDNGEYDDMIAQNIELFYPLTELSYKEIEKMIPPSQIYANLQIIQKVKNYLQKNKFSFNTLVKNFESILKKDL